MMKLRFIYRRVWREIHDSVVAVFRRRRMLRECCERGAMMQALLGVIPPAFRITELNFLNNPGEPMALSGPIFRFSEDLGDGPEFMRRMRTLRHFPYMELGHDLTDNRPMGSMFDNGSIRYDYVLYASEIARLDLMYRRGRAGRKVNRLTLPIINPSADEYREYRIDHGRIYALYSLLNAFRRVSGCQTASEVEPMYEFDLGKLMARNWRKVKNPFSYIPRMNIHEKADDGTIQYKIVVGNTVFPSECASVVRYRYELIRETPGFFKGAFDFSTTARPCALFSARDFNGAGRKLIRYFGK